MTRRGLSKADLVALHADAIDALIANLKRSCSYKDDFCTLNTKVTGRFASDGDGKTVRLTAQDMGVNSSTRLVCLVPSELASGDYRITVVTQFGKSKTPRKEAQSMTFPAVLTVA